MPTSPTPAADRPADQLRARLRAAAQRALESLDSLIADHQDPGAETLGARYELARELSNTSPEVARQLLGTTETEDDEETHVVTDDSDNPEHTDDCPGCEPAPPAPADRAAPLRDRIADALAAADGWEWGPGHDSLTSSVIGRYLRRADAVLAVLADDAADGVQPPTTPEARPDDIQVWPLTRVLTKVRCGSQDWTWDEEWADLDQRHAESGYLDRLEQEIKTRGITMPVLIGSDGRIWDGHHRLRIAVRLGIGYVPVEITPAREVARG
ncbi:ParB N-terminal domain-containing protein [Streptomyces anulatus]|uniref:ParB N-terminal domain-containing protein n=1 Tax=Streptomyces anulatus TaxID=1892 RepID=UPI00368B1437